MKTGRVKTPMGLAFISGTLAQLPCRIHGWLTSRGNFVVLNDGIEFAATYFIMLLSLFFTGAVGI